VGKRFGIRRPDRRKQAERDRQIVMRPLLGKVGRRQVDGDHLGRKCKADRRKRCANPLAALGDRLVGKPDNRESWQPGRELDLDLDRTGIEPKVCDGGDGGGQLLAPRADHALKSKHRPP
jgi:hypothetical protein